MLEVSDQGTSMVEFWWNSSSELQTTNQSLDSSSVSSRGSLASFCYAVLSHSVPSNSLRPHGLQPARILCPWDSPGKNTGVGCQFHLQGIFPTQGSNPGFLHCRLILLTTKPPGKSKNTGVSSLSLLWGPCWPRNRTRDSCMVGRFFTSWATSSSEWLLENFSEASTQSGLGIPWEQDGILLSSCLERVQQTDLQTIQTKH